MARLALAPAPAKINLGLEVLGPRPDGYHDIATILQTVTLYDHFAWLNTGEEFSYETAPGIDPETDLVARALATATDQYRWTGRLRLHKQIPLSAGLGGGSSNAALALRLARPDATIHALASEAVRLGSDVPFFIRGGTALATGTGTTLVSLPTPVLWFVIVTPPVQIPSKTATLYRALQDEDFSDGSRVSSLADALAYGHPITNHPPNAFERHLCTVHPVQDTWHALERAGAPWVAVSGAGPSMYTAVATFQQVLAIRLRLANDIGSVHIARTLSTADRDVAAENLAQCLRGGSPPR